LSGPPKPEQDDYDEDYEAAEVKHEELTLLLLDKGRMILLALFGAILLGGKDGLAAFSTMAVLEELLDHDVAYEGCIKNLVGICQSGFS